MDDDNNTEMFQPNYLAVVVTWNSDLSVRCAVLPQSTTHMHIRHQGRLSQLFMQHNNEWGTTLSAIGLL